MSAPNLVITEEDHTRFISILARLRDDANAKCTLLLDRTGQEIACVGDVEGNDPTSLASLTAGNVAATEGLAQLIGEDDFSSLYHEGRNDSLHISLVSEKIILLVIFDENSSLGLVRLRVQQITSTLEEVVLALLDRNLNSVSAAQAGGDTIGEITDEDIEALFG